MIYTLLVFIFVLGVLIFVHELGHFLASKLVGIQVLRFSIGLGKPLVSYRWGETEYALAAIPFGGYVKMAGDDPAEGLEGSPPEEQEPTDPKRHFDRKSIGARFLVIFAGPFMNFVLAALLYMGILYFQGAETYATTTLNSINKEWALPEMEQIRPGSKILSINGKEPAHWDDIRESCLRATSSRIEFLLLDGSRNERYTVSISAPDDSSRERLAYALLPEVEPRVGSVMPGKPAAKAGIKAGDLILKIDGRDIKSMWTATEIIHNSPEVALTLVLERDGEALSVQVTPEKGRPHQPDDTFETVGLIGIIFGPRNIRIPLSLTESVVVGAQNTVFKTVLIVRGLSHFFFGLISGAISLSEARDVLGGPVMIGQMAGEAARAGWLFSFMAFISLNLALLNLLPIPVLDGGHLLFLFIEVVRFGKPLSPQKRMRMIQVGLLIVFALMIFATANDLRRVFGF